MMKRILVLITAMFLLIPQKAMALSLAPPPESLPKEINLMGVYLLMIVSLVGLVVMAFVNKNDLVKWLRKYFAMALILGGTLLALGEYIVMRILVGGGFTLFGFSIPRINSYAALGYPEVTDIHYRDLYTTSNVYNLLVLAVVVSLSLWLRKKTKNGWLPWVTILVLSLVVIQLIIFLVGVGWTISEYVDFELIIDSIFSSLIELR